MPRRKSPCHRHNKIENISPPKHSFAFISRNVLHCIMQWSYCDSRCDSSCATSRVCLPTSDLLHLMIVILLSENCDKCQRSRAIRHSWWCLGLEASEEKNVIIIVSYLARYTIRLDALRARIWEPELIIVGGSFGGLNGGIRMGNRDNYGAAGSTWEIHMSWGERLWFTNLTVKRKEKGSGNGNWDPVGKSHNYAGIVCLRGMPGSGE